MSNHKLTSTHALSWMAGRRFVSLSWHDNVWALEFERNVVIVVECLWRLLDHGRLRVTSRDDGQLFGLPEPVDAAAEVNRRIAGAPLHQVELHDGTLDLDLHFAEEMVVQIIPDSSAYESWQVHGPTVEFIAVGGGNLMTLDNPPESD